MIMFTTELLRDNEILAYSSIISLGFTIISNKKLNHEILSIITNKIFQVECSFTKSITSKMSNIEMTMKVMVFAFESIDFLNFTPPLTFTTRYTLLTVSEKAIIHIGQLPLE